MEPKGLSPYSQQPTIGTYAEPDESNLHPQTLLRNIHFNIILPSARNFPAGLHPSGLSTTTVHIYLISAVRAACPAGPTRLGLVALIMFAEAPRYVVFTILPSLNFSYVPFLSSRAPILCCSLRPGHQALHRYKSICTIVVECALHLIVSLFSSC
jgi:hypothetical protein